MAYFETFETYAAIVHPVGILLNCSVLAFSACLSAIARSWRGWTTYAALTALVMFPLTFQVLTVKMHPPGPHSGLGYGLLIAFVGLPLAAAWLLGLLIGMLCRLGRSAKQGAQQP